MRSPVRLFFAAIGLGCRKPPRHPIARVLAAAKRGDADAQYRMGESYLAGWSVPRHPATGAKWLELAAAEGHVGAQYSLSLLYMSGARAIGDAAHWLRETQSGDAVGANAMLLYPESLDVSADPERGFGYAKAAAEQGLACAQANLGMFYLRGIGCQRNVQQAAQWFRRAAKQNESVGALGLGLLHEHGFGMARDPVEAARWYGISAALRNDAAATALGLLHLDGLGVDRDLVKARRLLMGPASRGDALAKKGLKEIDAMVEAETARLGKASCDGAHVAIAS